MIRGLAATLAAILLAVGATAAPARAQDVGSAELRELARAAATDRGARDRLASVDSVDGRALDAGAIIAGAQPDEIEARIDLALQSAGGGSRDGGGDAARERARELLDDTRYTGTDLPAPFTGPLRWLGEKLDPIADWIERQFDRIPGGPPVGWAIIAALVLGAALVLARLMIRRGAGRAGAGRRVRGGRAEDPGALERAADAAEAQGDFEAAVRLRFRAGLLRLDAGHVIAYRPSLTTGEVARELGSEAFRALGRDFDAIAYGGRPAGAQDAAAARERWRAVLAETSAGREAEPVSRA